MSRDPSTEHVTGAVYTMSRDPSTEHVRGAVYTMSRDPSTEHVTGAVYTMSWGPCTLCHVIRWGVSGGVAPVPVTPRRYANLDYWIQLTI